MFGEEDARLNQKTDARTNQKVALLSPEAQGMEGIAALRARWAEMPMTPKVVLDRAEGIDNSWPGFDLRTTLVGEESAGRFTIHDVIMAPDARLAAHHLAFADTNICVLDGQLKVQVGDQTDTLCRDGYCYIPEETTLALHNASAEPVRFFLWHSPAGAERAFAAAHRLWLEQPDAPAAEFERVLGAYGFQFHTGGEQLEKDALVNQAPARMEATVNSFEDFAGLRRDWSKRAPIPKIVHDRRQVTDIAMDGQDTKVLLSGDEASGRSTVFHYGIDPGYRAPAHHQPSEEEILMVLEGTLELTAGNMTAQVARGGFGFVPRYGTHGFVNPLETEARTVTINSPAGHERGFQMIVREGGSERFLDLLVAHGWHIHEVYDPGA